MVSRAYSVRASFLPLGFQHPRADERPWYLSAVLFWWARHELPANHDPGTLPSIFYRQAEPGSLPPLTARLARQRALTVLSSLVP